MPNRELTEAQHQLIVDHIDHIMAVGAKVECWLDRDDRKSLACEAAYRAAFSWRPDKGVSFQSYAVFCARRSIKRQAERRNKKRIETVAYSELHGPMNWPDLSLEEKEELALQRARLDTAIENLDDKQRAVIKLRRQGLTFREIGGRIGMTHDSAMRQFNAGVARLREMLGSTVGH